MVYGEELYKVLKELGYKVRLVNLNKTHDIVCRKKTDKVDSRIFADLLRINYLPEVCVPDEEMLRLRDITRHESNLARLRVEIQVKIKGYLLRKGVKYDRIWNEKVLSKLAEDDPDIKNLINVYWSLKEEEKGGYEKDKKNRWGYGRSKFVYVNARYRRIFISYDIGWDWRCKEV